MAPSRLAGPGQCRYDGVEPRRPAGTEHQRALGGGLEHPVHHEPFRQGAEPGAEVGDGRQGALPAEGSGHPLVPGHAREPEPAACSHGPGHSDGVLLTPRAGPPARKSQLDQHVEALTVGEYAGQVLLEQVDAGEGVDVAGEEEVGALLAGATEPPDARDVRHLVGDQDARAPAPNATRACAGLATVMPQAPAAS